VLFTQREILKITPRDPKRPPKDLTAPITWNLKRSISYEKEDDFNFKIWTLQNEAEYWKHLEFGTAWMPPRSFLRKWIIDNKDDIRKHFIKTLKKLI
jgi:HK97 gp10 family phage protein